jgi:hypothetical protein
MVNQCLSEIKLLETRTPLTRKRTKKEDPQVARTKDTKRRTRTTLPRNPLERRVTKMSRRSTSPSKRRILILIKNQLKMWPPLEKPAVVIEF